MIFTLLTEKQKYLLTLTKEKNEEHIRCFILNTICRQ